VILGIKDILKKNPLNKIKSHVWVWKMIKGHTGW
jgi:hypothetical protein